MKLELSTELTQRDKKLLVFLGLVLVVFGFGYFGIKPLTTRYLSIRTSLEKEQKRMEVNQEKEKRYESLSEYSTSLQEEAEQAAESFYSMMSSEEIDKLLTDLALKYKLEAKDLTIEISGEPAEVSPYTLSEKAAQMPAEEDTSEEEEGETESEARSIYEIEGMDELSEGSVIQLESAVESGIYEADIVMTVQGTRTNLGKMTDALINDYDSILVTGYEYSDEKNVSTDENLKPVVSKEETLEIRMNLYMYATAEEAAQIENEEGNEE